MQGSGPSTVTRWRVRQERRGQRAGPPEAMAGYSRPVNDCTGRPPAAMAGIAPGRRIYKTINAGCACGLAFSSATTCASVSTRPSWVLLASSVIYQQTFIDTPTPRSVLPNSTIAKRRSRRPTLSPPSRHVAAACLNLSSQSDFVLVVAWQLATLRSHGPYPLLAISGEQGSAKTVLSKMLKALMDPDAAPVRTLPREERELMIAANNAATCSHLITSPAYPHGSRMRRGNSPARISTASLRSTWLACGAGLPARLASTTWEM
jgi:hypothetical protein